MAEIAQRQGSGSGDTAGCGGCISAVLGFLLLWAIVFGVTVGGKHYGISGCSTDKGLEFDK